jgi:hypothetical protein
MKTKYNTFETTYRNARGYALIRLAGSSLADQRTYDTSSLEFQKRVYAVFKRATQEMFGCAKLDTRTWIVEQNALKTNHDGKRSLKALCYIYYLQAEGLFVAEGDSSGN